MSLDNFNLLNDEQKITLLENKIDDCKYWLSDGRTSNPKTVRNRKAWLKTYQDELAKLKKV